MPTELQGVQISCCTQGGMCRWQQRPLTTRLLMRQHHVQVRTREHQLSDEVLLDIQLPIAALAGHAGDAHGDVAFQLLDTPGPNESGAVPRGTPGLSPAYPPCRGCASRSSAKAEWHVLQFPSGGSC